MVKDTDNTVFTTDTEEPVCEGSEDDNYITVGTRATSTRNYGCFNWTS